MRTRPFALGAIALVMACHDVTQPTEPVRAPSGPSEIISDGAHCNVTGIVCNPDFFFLPPMVPLPLGNPNFELGKFNNTLRSSIRVDICELKSENLNSQGLPTALTGCVAGNPIKTFPAGSVNLVNLPLTQSGWWTLFNLPPDGFYYVLWDTRQSNLDVSKYYRIKVFINGATEPLGVADVDPMSSIFQWKYTLTGQVIQLVDDVMLPIPFRIEHGGGPALCGTATLCSSATITNTSATGSQVVTVDGGAGAIGGAKFFDGWLPPGGPQSVVVTVSQVDVGTTDPVTGTESNPCHPALTLQQFPGCFKFTTTPALQPIDATGRTFELEKVIAAVCYTLYGGTDSREPFAEMYASGPNEAPHALKDASDAGILSPATRNCSTAPVIGAASGNRLTQFASAGWRMVKSGVRQLFGVETAYGVDLGLGGFMTSFSNVGPAVTADLQPLSATSFTVSSGTIAAFQGFAVSVRAVGTATHNAGPPSTGMGGIPVLFSVASGNGYLTTTTSADHLSQLTAVTNSNAIDPSLPNSTGHADASWFVPNVAGTYTMTASSQEALGGPITYTVTVISDRVMLSMQTGATYQLSAPENTVATWSSTQPAKVQVDATGLVSAIVGGENSNGGDGATLTLKLNGAPFRLFVVDAPFDLFPRVTTAVWKPVTGATTYDIEIQYGNGCTGYANCTTWTTEAGAGATGITANNFTFTFVGTQPGRWRIVARDANGNIIPGMLDESGAPIPDSPSPWIFFDYIDGLQ